jgi:hypothetical protein
MKIRHASGQVTDVNATVAAIMVMRGEVTIVHPRPDLPAEETKKEASHA